MARDKKRPLVSGCPCGAGSSYAECCGVFHRLEAEAPTAEALMRSRYAAFVLGEHAYLWRTLHPDHDARAADEAAFLAGLERHQKKARYGGLQILDSAPPDADGLAKVLFFVELRVAGPDRSFAELSYFLHEGEGWRYLDGTTKGRAELARPPSELRITDFE